MISAAAETTTLRRRDVLDVKNGALKQFFAGDTWLAWDVFLAAIFGLPMGDAHAAIFRRCTGRQTLPTSSAREAWMIVGRRGGKSRIAALLAAFVAAFKRHRLAPGERGVVMIIAADRRQARVVFRYVRALFESPMLATLVERSTKEAVYLSNGVIVEVHTASFKAVRGYTVLAAILDEIAFWSTDEAAANPDSEILAALRPAMATAVDPLLVALSSPYAKRGALWDAHRKHFGQDSDPVLVWQADTLTMNPGVPQGVIDDAYTEDDARARAEYGAIFRNDIESYLSREVIDACVTPGCRQRPRLPGIHYRGFVDFAGGSGGDSATAAIAHIEPRDGKSVRLLDAILEIKPPFSPEVACQQIAALLKAYGVSRAAADRWGGQFPVEQMKKHGVHLEVSPKTKSEIYLDAAPLINSGLVELLDQPRLLGQLAGLERKTGRGGRDSVDHGPAGHDDAINSALGALVLGPSGVQPRCW
ncbi:MAG TPA: terminase family protein [Vicinamibacterales bacterium]|nr:terminase family protein [Vicinamibacterales bacterium]